MSRQLGCLVLVVAIILDSSSLTYADDTPIDPRGAEEFFEKRIRPLLADNCFNCHSAQTNSKGGLRVDDREGLLTGGQSGPAIVLHAPDESLLIAAVSHTQADLKMPPNKQLSPEQVDDLKSWIANGAPWPATPLPPGLGTLDEEMQRVKREHWAWQPSKAPAAPAVLDSSWAMDDIDRFVQSKWEEKGWSPQADAAPTQFVRRLYFDLTGLPPTPEEIDEYVADPSFRSTQTIVDKLLGSPKYGEQWGRHWLDVARYAESTGPSRNIPFPHAWRYRDYVLQSFNSDKPFDQFVQEQIAGDLLAAANEQVREEQVIATGFLALGVKDVNQRFRVRFTMDNVDEQIDTVTRSLLALTVSCARCHDHKFDPITSHEYYGLAGIFTSTDLCAGVRNKMGGGGLDYYAPESLIVLGPDVAAKRPDPAQVEELRQKVQKARSEFQSLKGKPEGNEINDDGQLKRVAARQKWNKLQQDLIALTDPAAQGIAVMGVRDASAPADTQLRIRGEAEKLGPVVPRGFLDVLGPSTPTITANMSGRLQLAQWITSPTNPLTSRVIVNRVWKHLFGEGLVRTVDNFGVTGEQPSHPELLDYLSEQFIQDGWSIKRLIKRLVLTRLYRIGSAKIDAAYAIDPDNRLLWRHAPRRLTAEEIRDALLFTAGNLDDRPREKSVAAEFRMVEIRNNGPEAKRVSQEVFENHHRSVYLPLLRDLIPISLTAFDFADQSLIVGRRDETNVPAQSLYFLNSRFILREASALSEKIQSQESDDSKRLNYVYRIVFGRDASTIEIERGLAFLTEYAQLAASDENLSVAMATPPTAPVPEAESTGDSQPTPANGSAPVTPERQKGKKKETIANPDDPDVSDQLFDEPLVLTSNPRSLAWMALCQSLYASAEFRYLP